MNDLKRDETTTARELGLPIEAVLELVRGDSRALGAALARVVAVWPVNERDLFPVHDDCRDGVLIMQQAESRSSARVIERGGRPYYEYRDTAMSRVSSLRPEWIEMLVAVDDLDPENPSVRWNNGHLLFQFTYFVGQVNYYYEWEGQKRCRAMNTGDSVFGLPYAKHSFAKRDPNETAFILALTYGARLNGDAQHELSALGAELAAAHALPSGGAAAWGALLCRHLANSELTVTELTRRTGLGEARLRALLAGREVATEAERGRLGEALQISPRELIPLESDTTHGVRILPYAEAACWPLPASDKAEYRMRGLASSRVTPFARSLEIEVLRHEDQAVGHRLSAGLHEFGYVVGDSPCVLHWSHARREQRRVLEPGDSFYFKPFVPHWLSGCGPGPNAPRLVVLRAGGKVVGDTALEASVIGARGLRRVAEDHQRWFDDQADRSDEAHRG
jgi:methylphosphonate synthase